MTPAQSKIYDQLLKAELLGETTPSYRELMEKAGLKSASGVHRIISALEQQGKVTRVKNTKRSIKININLSDYSRGYEKGFDDAKANFKGEAKAND